MDHDAAPVNIGHNDLPPPPSRNGGDGRDENENPNGKKSNVRKRTKTGCLTCRRRRIKCDEGRPICSNCIKSKRECEGYNKRLVFKNDIGGHGLSGPYDPDLYPGPGHHYHGQMRSPGQGALPRIAPRPPLYAYQHPPHYYTDIHGGHVLADVGPPDPSFDYNQAQYAQYPTQPNPLLAPGTHPASVPHNHPEHQQLYHPSVHTAQAIESSTAIVNRGPQHGGTDWNPPSSPEPVGHVYYEDEDMSLGESEDDDYDYEMEPPEPMALVRPGMLRGYFASDSKGGLITEFLNSPYVTELKDPRVQKLFKNFIEITGPSMSLYERHPFDPHEVADPSNPDRILERNTIWAYTFPVIAFRHPGLLHAMLALSSLQSSQIKETQPVDAHRHYHRAVRRVAKNITLLRRSHPATIAATLLLAYYEVWASDHTKWCQHLLGARQLFNFVPLREMSRKCLPIKSLKDRQELAVKLEMTPGDALPEDPNALDFQFISTLFGQPVWAEDFNLHRGYMIDPFSHTATDKDVDNYENYRDLYWWCNKMDVYQSMLGGNKPFLNQSLWSQCPPRAPMARLETIYGTYDHLMLLMARMTHFSAHDLPRKRKSFRGKAPPFKGASPPPFPGMVPTQGKVKLPMGFSPPRESSPPVEQVEDQDPETALQAALQEWESISKAFEAFEQCIKVEFKPLPEEFTDRRDHIFGPPIQYRTYSIAGVWMNYYMGLIYLHRCHPSMPPAALASVGLAAPRTGKYANLIARICIGISDDCSQTAKVSTVVGAAFIESALCLFWAAVQFQDSAQRHWVLQRMYDITRLTGWQSARQIADGCESSWAKAAQMGRGPPYERVIRENNTPSIWQNPRRIDLRMSEEADNKIVLVQGERSHYALGILGVEDDLLRLEIGDK